jgi:hypothetical protein
MIKIKNYFEIKEWFDNYIKNIIENNKNDKQCLEIKAKHCIRVSEIIEDIGKNCNLNESNIRLASIIGLLHDIGRFEQYIKYKTFSDAHSENHALLGETIIEKNKILEGINEHEKKIIVTSILNHNKNKIINHLNAEELFFTKLIRDADKIDIFNVLLEYYLQNNQHINPAVVLNFSETGIISSNNYIDFFAGKMLKLENISNLEEYKLLNISWIYDLNFKRSFEILHENKYIEKIIQTMQQNENLNRIKQTANNYIRSYLSN